MIILGLIAVFVALQLVELMVVGYVGLLTAIGLVFGIKYALIAFVISIVLMWISNAKS